jgi:endonuclease/exonuclease/phosphatase family metal-dependent hydrolase
VEDAWGWVERVGGACQDLPTAIAGDLNATVSSRRDRGGEHLRRLLANGWTRAQPAEGVSFPTANGGGTEIDHILANGRVEVRHSEYVGEAGGWNLAGGTNALSDHNALIATLHLA